MTQKEIQKHDKLSSGRDNSSQDFSKTPMRHSTIPKMEANGSSMVENGSSMTKTEILWSRYEDGGLCVKVTKPGPNKRKWIFEVINEDTVSCDSVTNTGVVSNPEPSKIETFKTAKALLVRLTGHPRARNWTLDRYFRIGKFEQDSDQGYPTILGLLNLPETCITLGIDLDKRGEEVAKLLFAGFGHQIHSAGLDPQDVLQEVYKGILIRNRGRGAFDPRKASFGHYVHMVSECVLSNVHRKANRLKSREQTGATGSGGDYAMGDVGESMAAEQASITIAAREGHPLERHALEDLSRYLSMGSTGDGEVVKLALLALPLVSDGYGRSEIAESLGVSKTSVSKALVYLRGRAKEWAS